MNPIYKTKSPEARWHNRVVANALGFVNAAFKPLAGAKRVASRGRLAGFIATLGSFFTKWAKSNKNQELTRARYSNGYNKMREMSRRVKQIQVHSRMIDGECFVSRTHFGKTVIGDDTLSKLLYGYDPKRK